MLIFLLNFMPTASANNDLPVSMGNLLVNADTTIDDCIIKTHSLLNRHAYKSEALVSPNSSANKKKSSAIILTRECNQCEATLKEEWINFFVDKYSDYVKKRAEKKAYFSVTNFNYNVSYKSTRKKFKATEVYIPHTAPGINSLKIVENKLQNVPINLFYSYRTTPAIYNIKKLFNDKLNWHKTTEYFKHDLIFADNTYVDINIDHGGTLFLTSKLDNKYKSQMIGDKQSTMTLFYNSFMSKLEKLQLSPSKTDSKNTIFFMNEMIEEANIDLIHQNPLLSDINDFIFFNTMDRDIFIQRSFLSIYNIIMNGPDQKKQVALLKIAKLRFYRIFGEELFQKSNKFENKLRSQHFDNLFISYFKIVGKFNSDYKQRIAEFNLLTKYLINGPSPLSMISNSYLSKDFTTEIILNRFQFMYQVFSMLDLSNISHVNHIPGPFSDELVQYVKVNLDLLDTKTYQDFVRNRSWLDEYITQKLVQI